jgi:hypothetical protein
MTAKLRKALSNDTTNFLGGWVQLLASYYSHLLHKLHSEVLDQGNMSARRFWWEGRICVDLRVLGLGWHFEASTVEDMY